MVYLCRQGGCYSTERGVQGYSRWWHRPAAHSQSGRRSSASRLLGKRPFQSSARWSRQRRGSCRARTFQLRGRTHTTDTLYHVESHNTTFISHFIEAKISGLNVSVRDVYVSDLRTHLGSLSLHLGAAESRL